MEYGESFVVTRRMHLRPYQEISETAANLSRFYPGIHIKIRNQDDADYYVETIGPMELFDIISHKIGSNTGSGIEVIAEGNFSEEILKRCVHDIGNLLIKKESS